MNCDEVALNLKALELVEISHQNRRNLELKSWDLLNKLDLDPTKSILTKTTNLGAVLYVVTSKRTFP